MIGNNSQIVCLAVFFVLIVISNHDVSVLSTVIITLLSSTTHVFSTRSSDTGTENAERPNIIVIIADDVGWNDFSFHGSSQTPTPNIDALAYHGVITHRFYTQSICTPSRSAFLTGNYALRTGMQGFPLLPGENRALPTGMPTMPEHFKRLGYKTHLVGKWHLGLAHREDTPTGKGFDTHFGYWNGFVGYYNYVVKQKLPNGTEMTGFDLHDNLKPAWSDQGKYATELFTEKSVEIIENHDKTEPLFLVLAHLAAHTGKDGAEIEVPNITETNIKYSYIKDPLRRRYADVVNLMDKSVGTVLDKLSERKMLHNSVVLFFSDNGAQTTGIYENRGSNWPLRGQKFQPYEGGVRGTGVVFSPLFKESSHVNKELIHISDWLPTLYRSAGGNLEDLGKIDGIDQWETLSENKPTKRSEMLTDFNEVIGFSSIITHNGRYKLVNGTNTLENLDEYYGEDGRGAEVPDYNIEEVLASKANLALEKCTGKSLQKNSISEKRLQVDISSCGNKLNRQKVSCGVAPCLFSIEEDPCETTNIANEYPEIVNVLWKRLEEFGRELMPQTNKPIDPASNPIYYNNTWCTWLDDSVCYKTPR